MAVSFTCVDCGKDGTRCVCYKYRRRPPKPPSVEERIKENDKIIEETLRKIRELNK